MTRRWTLLKRALQKLLQKYRTIGEKYTINEVGYVLTGEFESEPIYQESRYQEEEEEQNLRNNNRE